MARTRKHERQAQAHLDALAIQLRILDGVGDLQSLDHRPTDEDYTRVAKERAVNVDDLRSRFLSI